MSKVTKIIPDGATLSRADGSAVGVGDELSTWEALTLTIPAGSSGGSVQILGGGLTGHVISERVGFGVLLAAETSAPAAVTIPALSVGDTSPRAIVPLPRLGSPPAVKVNL